MLQVTLYSLELFFAEKPICNKSSTVHLGCMPREESAGERPANTGIGKRDQGDGKKNLLLT
jgi:hypothetical protein